MGKDLKTLVAFFGQDGLSSVTQKVSKSFDPLLSKGRILTTVFNDASRSTEGFAKSMDKWGGAFKSVGTGLSTYVTAPLAVMGGLAVKAGMDFDEALEGLQIRSGLSADAIKGIGHELDKLVTGSKFTSTQAVGALETLMKSNFKLQDSFDVMPSVIQLATATQMEFADSAKISAGVLRSYNMQIDQASRVNDILVKTTNVANTDLLQLSEAFKEVGPLAAQMNIPLEETTGILAQFALKNVQGAEAGSLLRKAMGKIIAPSTEAANILGGVLKIKKSDVVDSQGHLKSFAGFLDLLKKKGATTEQIIKIFGQRMGPTLAPLIQEGSGSIQEFIDKISGPNSLGAAAQTAAIRLEGPKDSVEKLHAAFTNFAKAIGESGLLDAFTFLVDKVTDLLTWMKQLSPTTLKIITVVAALAATLGPVLVIFGTILTMLPSMIIGFQVLAAAVGLVSLPFLGIAALAAAAIAAVGVLIWWGYRLYKDWDIISASFKGIWQNIKNIFFEGVSYILSLIAKVVDAMTFGLAGKAFNFATNLALGPPNNKGTEVQQQVATQNQTRTNNAAVSVDFTNLPRGTAVKQQSEGGFMDLGLGFAGALE